MLFLAEAFTRPKVMAKLAEVGFTQSYTYFTWRDTKQEFIEYGQEVSEGPAAAYMRPNFWPNTPDILAGPLRGGGPGAFRLRAVLAATMVPSWGVYGGFELLENEPASEANEEYLHSEKYELKVRDWDSPSSLAPFLAQLNAIRRAHPALQRLRGLRFHHSDTDQILAYSRRSADGADTVLVVVNLDPLNAHEDTLWLDLAELGLPWNEPYEAIDELNGQTYTWQGAEPYVRLDPDMTPAHIFHLREK